MKPQNYMENKPNNGDRFYWMAFLLMPLLALVGCSSGALSEGVSDGVMVGAPTIAAYKLSNGNPVVTGVTAVAAMGVNGAIKKGREKEKVELYNKGYDRGTSDVTRRLYWATKAVRDDNKKEDGEEKVIEVTLPAREENGVKRVASKKKIKVYEE